MISCFEKQHLVLVNSLKQTTQWILYNYASNVSEAHEGLFRFCSIVDDILTHGLCCLDSEKYWSFVAALGVIKPDNPHQLPSPEINGKKDFKNSVIKSWLHKSLLEQTLSNRIISFAQNSSYLKEYYKDDAFLRHASCVKVLLSSLCAVEQNNPTFFKNVIPDLTSHLSSSKQPQAMVEIPTHSNTPKFADSKNRLVPSRYRSPIHTSVSLDSAQKFSSLNGADCALKSSDSSPDLKDAYLYRISEPKVKRFQSKCARRFQKSRESFKSRSCKGSLSTNAASYIKCIDDVFAQPLKDKNANGLKDDVENITNCSTNPPISHSISCPDLPSYVDVSVQKSSSLPDLDILENQQPVESNSMYKISSQSDRELPIHSSCDKTLHCSTSESEYKTAESSDDVLNSSMDSNRKFHHLRSKSDGSGIICSKPVVTDSQPSVDDVLSSSLPSILPEQEQQKRKSIFEGGAVVVPTECFFPRPHPGQTLMSFLSSDFNICAELDRENAHFCISEALISAIEQIKSTESLKLAAEEAESDEEIKKLTQRIRIRRREKLQEKVAKTAALLSDGRTDTATTSQSASPMSTSHSSDFDAGDSIGSEDEDVADLDLSDHNASNLTSMKESGLSLSLASMYSDADIHKGLSQTTCSDANDKSRSIVDSNSIQLSAEVVALSLLKRFSEKQLPKASDLEWLVSEQDAPQRLLPLPDSWPVSPDVIDEECDLEKTRLRGNFEWAPPRQQIIFIIHPKPIKKEALLKQDYRCAGCGMRIEKSYAKKFRYCDYLGKFFCQCCHANNLTYIPGRIIWKWDFGKYYVSKFSWKLLDHMFHDPLFNVLDINPKQYRKIRQLNLCREYRTQLFYLKDFIRTCRDSKLVLKEIEQLPEHIYKEPHLYSICDFLKVKSGDMSKQLSSFVAKCTNHVMQCILCRGKGFICEMCDKSDDIIFPFQLNKVYHCPVCGCCFHKRCFKDGSCPKCIRIKERKRKLLEQKEQLYSDEEP